MTLQGLKDLVDNYLANKPWTADKQIVLHVDGYEGEHRIRLTEEEDHHEVILRASEFEVDR